MVFDLALLLIGTTLGWLYMPAFVGLFPTLPRPARMILVILGGLLVFWLLWAFDQSFVASWIGAEPRAIGSLPGGFLLGITASLIWTGARLFWAWRRRSSGPGNP